MAKYKKCERCELNYILAEEDYCKICKQEMKLEKGEDDEDLEICPICGVNYMPVNQIKCDECAKKKVNEETGEHTDIDEDVETLNDHSSYEDDGLSNNDDVEIISLSELEAEEDDEDIDDSFDDDDDGMFGKMGDDDDNSLDDDFDYVDPDDFDDDDDDDDENDDDDDDNYDD